MTTPADVCTAQQTVIAILGTRLLACIGRPKATFGDRLARLVIGMGRCRVRQQNQPVLEPAPDGVFIVHQGWRVRSTGGYTLGNYLFPRSSPPDRLFLIHEYVHVLQWRAEGASFLWHYARAGFWNWPQCDSQGWPCEGGRANRYERQAMTIEACYRNYPEMPDLWLLEKPG
ncbi:MAG: hypothetical protein ACYCZF_16855 [Anaerolineae bacterium]